MFVNIFVCWTEFVIFCFLTVFLRFCFLWGKNRGNKFLSATSTWTARIPRQRFQFEVRESCYCGYEFYDFVSVSTSFPVGRCERFCHPCDITKCSFAKINLSPNDSLEFNYYGPSDVSCTASKRRTIQPCGTCFFTPLLGTCPFCIPASSFSFCDGPCISSSPCPSSFSPSPTSSPPLTPPPTSSLVPPTPSSLNTPQPSTNFFPTPSGFVPTTSNGRPEVLIVFDEIMKELNTVGNEPILGCDGLSSVQVFIFFIFLFFFLSDNSFSLYFVFFFICFIIYYEIMKEF